MKLYFLIVSSSQATSSISTYVPILDGTNYREWAVQMRTYLQSVGLWLIVSGTTTAPTDPAELAKWTLSDSMANGQIKLRSHRSKLRCHVDCLVECLWHDRSLLTFWGLQGSHTVPLQWNATPSS